MRIKRVITIAIFFALCSGASGFAGSIGFSSDIGPYNSLPEPRLRYPINDTAVLTANEPLEFKWWDDLVGIRGFTLKIYKGYNMYAANLILKEDLPPGTSSFKASPDLFQDGQVYTWSLIRISYAGYKSDKSFNSFKVVKKQGDSS
ncbi:MAG: hypothetical protein PHT50_07720 [Candidatus Omnitrophica bacterium]|nr:hypothetical protein [Candidatus Omnitrophota bacterium]